MNAVPVGLSAAVLALWGGQTGWMIVAIAMGAALEGTRWLPFRWKLATADYRRILEVCGVIFLGVLLQVFFSSDGAGVVSQLIQTDSAASRSEAWKQTTAAILLFVQWWPAVFFPLVVVAACDSGPGISLGAVSPAVESQWRLSYGTSSLSAPVHFSAVWTYLSICLLAASATDRLGAWFFGALTVLLGWALWKRRSKAHSSKSFGISMGLAAVLGLVGVMGVHQVKVLLDDLNNRWVSNWTRGSTARELDQAKTSIGSIGRLKLSGKIVMRLAPSPGQRPPELLREATLTHYRGTSWRSPDREFQSLLPDDILGSTWSLGATSGEVLKEFSLARSFRGKQQVLALPLGTLRIQDLSASLVQTNGMGAVRAQDVPSWMACRILYGNRSATDRPPVLEQDLDIPDAEAEVIQRMASDLGLSPGITATEACRRVSRFFNRHFEYSTFLKKAASANRDASTLAPFLLLTRSGHCEYFATATVLLLRAAGIPTRYAVGYSVQEKKGETYVVRQRHAHAWCLVYDAQRGDWMDYDTTPGSWSIAEAGEGSFWEPVGDLWADACYQFHLWRFKGGQYRRYTPWLLLPLLCLTGYRLVFKSGWSRSRSPEPSLGTREDFPGSDSEFYRVLDFWEAKGFPVNPGETLSRWAARLPVTVGREDWMRCLSWHQRLRFHPSGLKVEQRRRLVLGVDAWIHAQQDRDTRAGDSPQFPVSHRPHAEGFPEQGGSS